MIIGWVVNKPPGFVFIFWIIQWAFARVVPLAVAVTLLVALDSCGSPETPSRSADGLLDEGTVNLSDQDKNVLYLAEEILVSRCMNKKGSQYLVVEGFSAKEGPAPSAYSSDDVVERAQHGYGLTTGQDQPRELDINGKYLSTLSSSQRRQYDEALLGPLNANTGQVRLLDGSVVYFTLTGCVANARTQLYGNNMLFMETSIFVENLRSEVERRVLSDDRYLAALDAWRQCMHTTGYVVENPDAAVKLASSQSLPDEKEIAVADANCSQRTRLTATGRALDRTYEAKIIAEQRHRVDIYAQMLRVSLPKAREIVKS